MFFGIVILILWFIFLFNCTTPFRYVRANVLFNLYADEFSEVQNWLDGYSCALLYNDDGNYILFFYEGIYDSQKKEIKDEKVKKNLSVLFDKAGIDVIIKKNEIIEFQKWSTLDNGYGVMYATSKESRDNYMTKHIFGNTWWYYETLN